MKNLKLHSVILLILVLLSACNAMQQESITQGQTINSDTIDQLELGMNEDQVRLILGSPSLIDTFDSSQWIYFFSEARINKKNLSKQGNLRLYFKDRLLSKVEKNGFVIVESNEENLNGGTVIIEPTQKKRTTTINREIAMALLTKRALLCLLSSLDTRKDGRK